MSTENDNKIPDYWPNGPDPYEGKYMRFGDEELSQTLWVPLTRDGVDGLWEGEHWLWNGGTKVSPSHPAHGPFMAIHPARREGAKRFIRMCSEESCVRPEHWCSQSPKYWEPLDPWAEVDLDAEAERRKKDLGLGDDDE